MMTDQPTPTSSLEEARRWVRYEGCDTCDRDHMTAAHLAGQAAARAEVIREVEAVLAELENPLTCWDCGALKRLGCYPDCVAARLRALFQGGEEKSDE